jgi:hypothetical protein
MAVRVLLVARSCASFFDDVPDGRCDWGRATKIVPKRRGETTAAFVVAIVDWAATKRHANESAISFKGERLRGCNCWIDIADLGIGHSGPEESDRSGPPATLSPKLLCVIRSKSRRAM